MLHIYMYIYSVHLIRYFEPEKLFSNLHKTNCKQRTLTQNTLYTLTDKTKSDKSDYIFGR